MNKTTSLSQMEFFGAESFSPPTNLGAESFSPPTNPPKKINFGGNNGNEKAKPSKCQQKELDLDGRERFTFMWDKEKSALLNFVRSISKDPEELFQQVGVYAWRGFNKLKEPFKFGSWLRQIAINTNINFATSLYKQKEIPASDFIDYIKINAKDGCGFTAACNTELMEEIMAAVGSLPEPLKNTYVKYELEGMAYRDLATITGKPEGTLRQNLCLAKKILKERLAHLQPN